MQKSEGISELTKALCALQSELKPVPKDSINPFFKSKYADISAIWESCRPLLSKNKLSVSQLPGVVGAQIVLTTILMHESGEWISSDLLVTPSRNKLDKDQQGNPVHSNVPYQPNAQEIGSALTYARRYALSAILGVCSEEDDDAEAAVGRTKAKVAAKAESKPASPSYQNGGEKGPLGPKGAGFANAGEFLTACQKDFGLNRSQVLDKLGATTFTNVNFTDTYQLLKELMAAGK